MMFALCLRTNRIYIALEFWNSNPYIYTCKNRCRSTSSTIWRSVRTGNGRRRRHRYGRILENNSSSLIRPRLDDSVIITSIDSGYWNLYNATCLNGEIMCTSGLDNSIKPYNLQEGLLESIQTNSGSMPDDMAVTMGGDLVYTDSNDRSINNLKGAEIQPIVMLQERKPLGVFMFVFCLLVWDYSFHSRIFHSHGDVTNSGEGLQMLTYARHLRPSCRKGS